METYKIRKNMKFLHYLVGIMKTRDNNCYIRSIKIVIKKQGTNMLAGFIQLRMSTCVGKFQYNNERTFGCIKCEGIY